MSITTLPTQPTNQDNAADPLATSTLSTWPSDFAETSSPLGHPLTVQGTFQASRGYSGISPGAYVGYACFNAPTGSRWWTPPTGATTVTATDRSGNPGAKVEIIQSLSMTPICVAAQTSVPVRSARQYQFTTYFTHPGSAPEHGSDISIDIAWT